MEVEEFLQSINLLKYKDTFIQNGIDDLDVLLELSEEHLELMKIPLGHKLKILKKIKDFKKNPASFAPTTSSTPQLVRHIFTLKTTSTSASIGAETAPGGQLLKGAYNEDNSHKSFLDALDQWRSKEPEDQDKENLDQSGVNSANGKVSQIKLTNRG